MIREEVGGREHEPAKTDSETLRTFVAVETALDVREFKRSPSLSENRTSVR